MHCSYSFFVDHPCNFHALSNSFQEIPYATTSTHSHFYVFKAIVWDFYWNSLIQDVWAMTSSEWELYVAAKLLANFQRLKGISTFLLILDNSLLIRFQKKASAVGLDNLLSSNLRIIILS